MALWPTPGTTMFEARGEAQPQHTRRFCRWCGLERSKAARLAALSTVRKILLRCCGFDARAQAGFIPRGSVLVNCALLYRFVDDRHRLADTSLNCLLVAFSDGFAQRTQRGTQSGFIRAIDLGTFFRLTGALK